MGFKLVCLIAQRHCKSSGRKRHTPCLECNCFVLSCCMLKVSSSPSTCWQGGRALIGATDVATSSAPSARKTSPSATAFSATVGSARGREPSSALCASLLATALTSTNYTWRLNMGSFRLGRCCQRLYNLWCSVISLEGWFSWLVGCLCVFLFYQTDKRWMGTGSSDLQRKFD